MKKKKIAVILLAIVLIISTFFAIINTNYATIDIEDESNEATEDDQTGETYNRSEIKSTRSSFRAWFKNSSTEYGDTAKVIGLSNNGHETIVYTKFSQIFTAEHDDRIAMLLDMVRRFPMFCIELGKSTPTSKNVYAYKISYRTIFDGLTASRNGDKGETGEKKTTTDKANGVLSYIICNRYSNWYNTSGSTTTQEKYHTKDCIGTTTNGLNNLDNEYKKAFINFKSNNYNTVKHNNSWSNPTLYMNIGQHAVWNYWETWLNSGGNQASDEKLYSLEYWTRGKDTYTGTGNAELSKKVEQMRN